MLANRQRLHRRLAVVHCVGVATVSADVDLAVGPGNVCSDAGGLHATDIAGRNALHRQRIAILIGVHHVATGRRVRRHIAAHTGAIRRCHAFVNGGRVGIGNRQAVEGDSDVLVCRQLAAAALFLRTGCGAGRATAGGIGILVVDGDAQGHTGVAQRTRRRDAVAVGDALQCGVDPCAGCFRTGECQGQRAIRIGIGTNGGAIDLEHVACIQIQAGCNGARCTKDIVCTGATGTGDGQHRTGPVVARYQFQITQCGVVVDTNRCARLYERVVPDGAQTGDRGCVVYRVDRDAAGRAAGRTAAADQVRVGVGHRPGQGAAAGECIAGRVLVAVAEGHRLQHQRIVGQGVGARERQRAGAAVVADNRDLGGTRHRQRVVVSLQPGRDPHRGTGGLGIVHIAQRQTRRDRDRTCSPFREAGVGGRDHRCISRWREGDGAAQGSGQRCGHIGARVLGVGAVTESDCKHPTRVGVVSGRVVVAGVAKAQLRQQGLHRSRGGRGAGEVDHHGIADTVVGGVNRGKAGASITDDAAGNTDVPGQCGVGQHRQRVTALVSVQTHRQRARTTGVEVCRAVRVAHCNRATHKLQRRGVAFGVSAAQRRGRHDRRVVVTHDGHAQCHAQGRAGSAIAHGIGQRARCHRRIGRVLEGQVFEDALGNRGSSRRVQRDNKAARRAAAGRANADPADTVVVLHIAATELDIVKRIDRRARKRNHIRRDQAADGDGAAAVVRAVGVGQRDALVDPVGVHLNQVFVEALVHLVREARLVVNRVDVDRCRGQRAARLARHAGAVVIAGVGQDHRHAAVAVGRVVGAVDVADAPQQGLEAS